MIYLDYAATTPMSEQSIATYAAVAREYYGNASSLHEEGSRAKQVADASKNIIAGAMGAQGRHIHMVGGASEGNFLAIYALLDGIKEQNPQKKHILCSPLEHDSVAKVISRLQNEGWQIEYMPVSAEGVVSVSATEELIREDTALLVIQLVNSELGTLQPVKKLSELAHAQGARIHCDAVQAFGKLEIDVSDLGVDALSVSAHKIYGPKGIGAVWMHPNVEWNPFLANSTRKSFRPGTLPIPSMAAFAAAVKEAMADRAAEYERVQRLRDHWIEQLSELPNTPVIEGSTDRAYQSPFILGLRFPGMEGQFFMLECDQAGIGISTGSACQAGTDEPNVSMRALAKSDQEISEFVRISFGKGHTEADISRVIPKIRAILERHYSHIKIN